MKRNVEESMTAFYTWLEENFHGGVVLVGHGAFSNNSARRLIEDFRSAGYSDAQIKSIINGFSDSLLAFQKNYPGQTCLVLTCNKLLVHAIALWCMPTV